MVHKSLLFAAITFTALLTGCTTVTPEATPSAGTPSAGTPSAGTPSATTQGNAAAPPSCAEVRNASVHGVIDPYYAFGDEGAKLTEGMYSDKDGLVLAVQQPCASGDLGGDIRDVTVATIMNSVTGTTGRFWHVMLCWTVNGKPKCTVHIAMNDRDPIESVSVSAKKLTLVYLTRPDNTASAVVSVRRTAIFEAEGTLLKERSRSDVPYTP